MARRRQGKRLPENARPITDPLAVIPFLLDNVERKYDSEGRAHLRQRVPLSGLKKKIAERFGYDYSKKMMLDEYGTAYISQVDGETPLRSIIARMADQFEKPRNEMESSVMLFTKTLMIKQLIALRVPDDAQLRDKDE